MLAELRNALEHLDEAEFEGGNAVPGDKGWSLKALPNSRLAIEIGHRLAFSLIDVDELERRALAVVGAVEEELMEAAADWWAEMNSGRLPAAREGPKLRPPAGWRCPVSIGLGTDAAR
ncbi:MAG: hypothetical protein ACRDPY_33830 [Streptosporangiaceae bacterium]